MSWFKNIQDRIEKSMNRPPQQPKEMSDKEQIVLSIVQNLLAKPSTDLSYDPETHECFMQNGNYFVTLEAQNVSVINSKFGYDITISVKMEAYIGHLFREEAHKRRQEFKNTTQEKVEHSLQTVLIELEKKKT